MRLAAKEPADLGDLMGFFGSLMVRGMVDILYEMPQEQLYWNLWSRGWLHATLDWSYDCHRGNP